MSKEELHGWFEEWKTAEKADPDSEFHVDDYYFHGAASFRDFLEQKSTPARA